MKDPLVFDIARASFVDGPGLRTTVFFKGCPLSCPWCHNPESQSYNAETMFFAENCIMCGQCEKGLECFARARRTIGKAYSPEQLAESVLEDSVYYRVSGGGVTFSGGEALGFASYLSKVLELIKKEGIHVAVQTCGYFNYNDQVEQILAYVDEVYFDFKIMDDLVHKEVLGKSNDLILENFKRLIKEDLSVIPRITLVPGYTSTYENLDAAAAFFVENQIGSCHFLYYNPCGSEKLLRLKRTPASDLPEKSLSPEENQKWIQYFKDRVNGLKMSGPV